MQTLPVASAAWRGAIMIVVLCLLVAGALSTTEPLRTVDAQESLPALPARWPSTVQLGVSAGLGDAAGMRASAPFGFRYQYLAGGVNTGNGWANWNPDGAYVTYYVQESQQNDMSSVFTYYQMLQSAPGNSRSDSDGVYTNLQTVSTMRDYYNDLKLFFQRAGAFPQSLVVLHVEPDLWGFLEPRAANDDASTVPAQVASTGLPELTGLPNNLSGFARAIISLRDQYAPNVLVAYHLSVWGTGDDILYSRPDNATVAALATRAGNYFVSLNANFDLAFAEYSDRDAAFKQYQYNDGGAAWWRPDDFSRNELFISRFVSIAQKRVAFWQIPVGNTKMRAMNNTWWHYQDNHVEWLLDDATRANLNAYVQTGAIAFMFGPGAGGATCYCDAANDGVTNPAPINGNDMMSLSADDDGGFFRWKAGQYYAQGAMPLRGGGGPPPTNTPIPTVAPTVTVTPTPTPTSVSGPQTITFANLNNPDRLFNGQYPPGVIDWGSGAWFLSGPYDHFAGNSVSFNGASPTSASFSFVSPRRLLRLNADNGGATATTISVSCAGQPTREMVLSPGQVGTLQTGWTSACSPVNISSTNGWYSNFDQFVIQ